MWDLETLKKLNDERCEYLKRKKTEKSAIKKLVKDFKSKPVPEGC